jgi:site-specific recombinase XerD
LLTNNSFNNKKVARIDKTDITIAARLPAIKNLYSLFFRNKDKREMQMAAIPSPRLKERLPKIDII